MQQATERESDIEAGDTIAVMPVGDFIGAEVSGIDLSRPLSSAAVARIERALVAHKVLFFRDQTMTSEEHLALGRQFGPLEVHPFTPFTGKLVSGPDDRHPELIVLESRPEKPEVAEAWHSDVTWRETPSLGSILRVTDCPPRGGDTLWADMAAAYEGLDDAMRARLSGMVAVHDWHGFRERMRQLGHPAGHLAALEREFPPAEHPVVRTHPVSGQKAIYVNVNFTLGIKGMGDGESRALLDRLYALAEIPDYQVRMKWQPGSVAFWDNRSTQHRVINDATGYRRMERVTIAGDRPF